MSEFKGTKGKFYAVEYTGFFAINDEPYYDGKNVLWLYEVVAEEKTDLTNIN